MHKCEYGTPKGGRDTSRQPEEKNDALRFLFGYDGVALADRPVIFLVRHGIPQRCTLCYHHQPEVASGAEKRKFSDREVETNL